MVNLLSSLHNVSAVPTCMDNIKTTARKIFNVVSDIDFFVGTRDLSCECTNSPFLYRPAGHVVTGNLCIVQNRQIRKLSLKEYYSNSSSPGLVRWFVYENEHTRNTLRFGLSAFIRCDTKVETGVHKWNAKGWRQKEWQNNGNRKVEVQSQGKRWR